MKDPPHAHSVESYRAKILEWMGPEDNPSDWHFIEYRLVQRELAVQPLDSNELAERIMMAYKARHALEEEGAVRWGRFGLQGRIHYYVESVLYRLAAI